MIVPANDAWAIVTTPETEMRMVYWTVKRVLAMRLEEDDNPLAEVYIVGHNQWLPLCAGREDIETVVHDIFSARELPAGIRQWQSENTEPSEILNEYGENFDELIEYLKLHGE